MPYEKNRQRMLRTQACKSFACKSQSVDGYIKIRSVSVYILQGLHRGL